MGIQENPCLPCNSCCSLEGQYGLRLSQGEFNAHFKDRQKGLQVRVENKMVILSSKKGQVCPNLGKEGCRIYLDRPIDCRLYPHQMELVYETENRVKFIFHSQSDCPKKEDFLSTEAEARALILEFGRKVYGNKKIIVQKQQDCFLWRLKNKCELVLVNFFEKK